MIILENEFLRIEISTGRGARIEKFYDKKNDKNWVWKPHQFENGHETLGLEANFDEHWAGGWEEVFPNDAPSEIDNHKLVDHGEVWRRNWNQDGGGSSLEAKFYFKCLTYPVLLRKSLILAENKGELTVNYEIESQSARSLPYIFKFHPALEIEAGDTFDLPSGTIDPVAPGFGNVLSADSEIPYEKGMIDVALACDGFKREFVKFKALDKGSCGIKSIRTNSRLNVEFSSEDLPYMWLFQSYGGFRQHYVAMLEPTNAGHYDLSLASKEKKCGFLNPWEIKKFSLVMRVT